MKKLILLLSLSGCANVTFDHAEYDRFVTIKATSDIAVPYCGKPEVNQYITNLHKIIEHEKIYASYKGGNEQVAKSSVELGNIINGLYKKVEKNEPMSEFYCKEKLTNVSQGSIRVMETLGGF